MAPVAWRARRCVERWAGLRPKAIDRDPMIGRASDAIRSSSRLTGGFKVSFGLAHRLAEAAVHTWPTAVPQLSPCRKRFAFSSHITAASR
ncbi:hypothetical protein [Rhizobium yanglingense]